MFRKMACRVVLTSTNMISSTACHLDPMDSMLQLQILSRGLGKLQTMSVPFTQIQYTKFWRTVFPSSSKIQKIEKSRLGIFLLHVVVILGRGTHFATPKLKWPSFFWSWKPFFPACCCTRAIVILLPPPGVIFLRPHSGVKCALRWKSDYLSYIWLPEVFHIYVTC